MNLQDFLNQNIVEGLTREISLGDRFIDEKGDELRFRIKAIGQEQFNELKRRATTFDKKGRMIIDEGALSCLIVIENTLNPSFKDMESLKKLGCVNAQAYLSKVLLAGEIEALASEILKLSGFNDNINDMAQEIKN